MNHRRFAFTAGVGCAILAILLIVVIPAAFLFPLKRKGIAGSDGNAPLNLGGILPQTGITTTSTVLDNASTNPGEPSPVVPGAASDAFVRLYDQLHPGIVSVHAFLPNQSSDQERIGSGMIIQEDGLVLTNHSLVNEAAYLTVIFFSGDEAEASLIGSDATSNLAVLKVASLPVGAIPLRLDDTDSAKVGEWVIVLSNSLGTGSTLNVGTISAKGPALTSQGASTFLPQTLQVDADFHSEEDYGGAVLNLRGEVIGVTGWLSGSKAQTASPIRYAIPSNLVRRIVPALVENGTFAWAWLGVEGESVNLPIIKANELSIQSGAYIHKVIPGSPADQAGLRGSTGTRTTNEVKAPVGGDVVFSADDTPVTSMADLLTIVTSKNPGDPLNLAVIRDGKLLEFMITLVEQPED